VKLQKELDNVRRLDLRSASRLGSIGGEEASRTLGLTRRACAHVLTPCEAWNDVSLPVAIVVEKGVQ